MPFARTTAAAFHTFRFSLSNHDISQAARRLEVFLPRANVESDRRVVGHRQVVEALSQALFPDRNYHELKAALRRQGRQVTMVLSYATIAVHLERRLGAESFPAGRDHLVAEILPAVLAPLPLESNAASDAGDLVRLLVGLPTWYDGLHAHLMAGAVVLPLLVTRQGWRPQLWLSGAAGSGKSALLDGVLLPLWGEAGRRFDDFTPAGLRQVMQTVPVVAVDAADEDPARTQALFDLMREAAPGGRTTSTTVLRGGVSKSTTLSTLNPASLLAVSQRAPEMALADESRILSLELVPASWSSDPFNALSVTLGELAGVAQRLGAAGLAGLMAERGRHLQATATLLQIALGACAPGIPERRRLVLSQVLAGAWLLSHPQAPLPEQVDRWLRSMDSDELRSAARTSEDTAAWPSLGGAVSQKQLTTVVGPTNSLPRSDFSLVEGQARPAMGQTFTAFNTYVVPGEEQPQSPPPADVGERVALVDLADTVDLLRLKMARQVDPENKADPLEAMFSPL